MKLPRLIRSLLDRAGVEVPRGRVSQGIDVIGDIAIFKVRGMGDSKMKKLATALLDELPNVRCVFEQVGAIEGEFRLRRLRHVAGEKRTLTLHRENGCAFKVDVRKCYFSPRLSTERLRVAGLARKKERVLNMFAGVGPFSIEIAKKSGARVTSCELNGYACRLHTQNNELNKVSGLVEVINSDAEALRVKVKGKFDRVVMPHPSAANLFLKVALSLVKKGGMLHYYRHVLGRSEVEAEENLRAELGELLPRSRPKVGRVVEVGPRWLEMVADVRV